MRYFNAALVMALVFVVFVYKHNQKMDNLKQDKSPRKTVTQVVPDKAKPTGHTAYNKLDIVSLFGQTGPQIGLNDYFAVVRGQTYYFANAENLQKFKARPASYQPQFDGLATIYLAQGYQVAGKPEHAAVYNNRLFFFDNAQNRQQWNMQPARIYQMAFSRWRKIQEEKQAVK